MIRLTSEQEGWKDDLFPGVRIRFAPITRKSWRAAQRAAAAMLRAARDGDGKVELTDELTEDVGDEVSRILMLRGIIEWDGIADADGNAVAVSPETIELLIADPARFEKIDAAYVMPFVLRDMEGNVSAGSPNGISAGATPASDTATSAAAPATATGATPARISSTRSKPKKPRTSGKS